MRAIFRKGFPNDIFARIMFPNGISEWVSISDPNETFPENCIRMGYPNEPGIRMGGPNGVLAIL